MARVLVTGVNGQIGTYLAESLLAEGHEVLGVGSKPEPAIVAGVRVVDVPLTATTVGALLQACGPLDAIVHLAGRSSVARSWGAPLETYEIHGHTTAALVAAIVESKSNVAFVHASSAEIFGRNESPILSETTPIAPVSPYGASKAAAHLSVAVGRDGYAQRMSNLIYFPGESERRAPHFVFRKITRGIAAVHLGRERTLTLGNTSFVRDFCHARDFAAAAKLLAVGNGGPAGPPGDYVVATGVGHPIYDVAVVACELFGLDPSKIVRTDPALYRGTDIPSLVGDSTRLRAIGWAPTMQFRELVETITKHDLAQMRTEE